MVKAVVVKFQVHSTIVVKNRTKLWYAPKSYKKSNLSRKWMKVYLIWLEKIIICSRILIDLEFSLVLSSAIQRLILCYKHFNLVLHART